MDKYISKRAAIDMICSKCAVDKPESCSTIQEGDDWCEEVYRFLKTPAADVAPYSIEPDGTLTITVPKGTKVGRVLVEEEVKETLTNLPSAQPEPFRINLNEIIKVKLTDWGKEIYYHQHDRVNQIAGREICKPSFPKEDENGYTEFQLWCFIELYGTHMGMTLPNVIEPIEIVYESGN